MAQMRGKIQKTEKAPNLISASEAIVENTQDNNFSSVYQGPPTHALQKSLNRRTLDTATVNRLGRGEIKQGEVTIFIEKFKEARGNLRPSVSRLFYAGVIKLAHLNI